MWTKLIQAIEQRDVEAVRLYLSQEPKLALQGNYHDETPLHFAAGRGSYKIVVELLNVGAKADMPDEFGWTPLHEACAHGHADIVALFIDAHTNLEVISKKHKAPLHLAAYHSKKAVLKLLLDAGANREVRNERGETPLHVAAAEGDVEVMKLLLEAKADVNARTLDGETPLHLAAHEGDIEVAELCLSYGANPTEEEKHGNNFLEIAMRAGKRPFLEHFAGLELKAPASQPAQASAEAEGLKTAPKPAIQSGDAGKQGGQERQIRPTTIMKVKEAVADLMNPQRGMLNVFFLGSPTPGSWFLTELLDTLLWFFVFPLLLFIVWMGFHQKIIPGLVSFSGTGQAESLMLLVQTAINTMIVLVATSLLCQTDKASVPLSHYLHYLRENVRMRVMQLALVDYFIAQRMTYNNIFLETFIPFWAGFMALYGVSFLCWWIETGKDANAPKTHTHHT